MEFVFEERKAAQAAAVLIGSAGGALDPVALVSNLTRNEVKDAIRSGPA